MSCIIGHNILTVVGHRCNHKWPSTMPACACSPARTRLMALARLLCTDSSSGGAIWRLRPVARASSAHTTLLHAGSAAAACTGGPKQGQYMDLNHFLRHFSRRRRQRRQPAIARPTAICAPSPPGGPASGAHRSECGGRSDGRRSTCTRALGRGGLWRARERWRRWPRPARRTPRSAVRAPAPRGRSDRVRRRSAAVSGSTSF